MRVLDPCYLQDPKGDPLATRTRVAKLHAVSTHLHKQHDRMFSHQFYNLVHIVGLVLLVSGLGGMALRAAGGAGSGPPALRRLAMALHGFGAFLILLGGFGMLARMGIVHGSGWPAWLWVKVAVLGVLAAAALLPYRWPSASVPLLLLLPVLGGLAAYMAIYKPI